MNIRRRTLPRCGGAAYAAPVADPAELAACLAAASTAAADQSALRIGDTCFACVGRRDPAGPPFLFLILTIEGQYKKVVGRLTSPPHVPATLWRYCAAMRR